MEKGIRNSIIGILFLFLAGCGSANKTAVSPNDSKALDEIVMSKPFKIEAAWARPLMTSSMNSVLSSGLLPPGNSGNRINLMGNGNYLQVTTDKVVADLPYYGERQMGGGYNSNTGIKFEGVPKDLEIIKNEQKQRVQINFTIMEQVESYQVRITVSPKLNGTILITSSQRNSIWYEGKVTLLDASEEG